MREHHSNRFIDYSRGMTTQMQLGLIVCTDSKGGIAKDGGIPWYNQDDMRHFFSTTIGNCNNAVIMGRTTWESLTYKPLSHRVNIVVSSVMQEEDASRLCRVARTPEAAVELARELNVDEAWIIGGRQVYKALDQHKDLSVVYKTILLDSYDCDTFYFFSSRDFKEDEAPTEIDRGNIHKLVRA
jgi:dihydrofolate reductase